MASPRATPQLEIHESLRPGWRIPVLRLGLMAGACVALWFSALSLLLQSLLALALLVHQGLALCRDLSSGERVLLRTGGELWFYRGQGAPQSPPLRLSAALALGPWLLLQGRAGPLRYHARLLHRREQPELWRRLKVLADRLLGS